MIDVGGAALLGAAARNAAGVAAVADPAHYARIIAELREIGPGQPGDCARSSPPRRSARSPRTTPRSPPTSTRSRAPPSRSGSRWSSRRWTTCATARTRTSAARSTARRPTAAAPSPTRTRIQGDAALVQQPARPRRAPTGSPATTPPRRSPSPSTPTRSGSLARRARRGVPARARDRPGRVVRRRSSASTASWTAPRPARSPRTRTRR